MSEIDVSDELLRITEAIIFANGDPVTADRIARGAGVSTAEAHAAARKLQRSYAVRDGALEILTINGAYQIAVKTDYSEHIRKTLDEKKNTALSNAAMETLAIAAYNQPVTKSFIENIRGVDSSGVVNSLVEKELLEECGRLDLPGRPIAYKTTDNFLRCFKLSSLDDLPEIITPESLSEQQDEDSEEREE
ncbi:SMC-Scp complex subunit ScpB [Ruminococcus sp. NK3A76]|uniref:SMC-Scp complex subunit ScpB n=1 Tax=Ruminococcus sp. NK3A76 TaxID=877411 RepID=UPI00056CFD33|nr:SMC-Scp complex subunit ScpB [Ruminococcus sp. NK3A76]